MNENLPPLPPGYGTMSGTTAYTAKQMHQYALDALAMAAKQRAEAQRRATEFNAVQIRSYQEKQP